VEAGDRIFRSIYFCLRAKICLLTYYLRLRLRNSLKNLVKASKKTVNETIKIIVNAPDNINDGESSKELKLLSAD